MSINPAGSILSSIQSGARRPLGRFAVRVKAYEGDTIVGRRTDTGEEVRVRLRAMATGQGGESRPDQRRTVAQLASTHSYGVAPGGCVRVDKPALVNGVYEAAYLRKLTSCENDPDLKFCQVTARPYAAMWSGDGSQRRAVAAVDLLFNKSAITVSGHDNITEAIIDLMEKVNGNPSTSKLGTAFVLIREPGATTCVNMPNVYRVKVGEGQYRHPTRDEIMTTFLTGKKSSYRRLMEALATTDKDALALELVPCLHCPVGAETASSSAYHTLVRDFFQKQKPRDDDGGVIWYSQFREAIITFKRYNNGDNFYISDLAPTLNDGLSPSGIPVWRDRAPSQEPPANGTIHQQTLKQSSEHVDTQAVGRTQSVQQTAPSTMSDEKPAIGKPEPAHNRDPSVAAQPATDPAQAPTEGSVGDAVGQQLSELVDLEQLPDGDIDLAMRL